MRIPLSTLPQPGRGGAVIDRTWLMAEWARHCPAGRERVAWVTLDAHDNDRVLFWTAVPTAARHATGSSTTRGRSPRPTRWPTWTG